MVGLDARVAGIELLLAPPFFQEISRVLCGSQLHEVSDGSEGEVLLKRKGCGRDVLEEAHENVDSAFWTDRLERSPPGKQA